MDGTNVNFFSHYAAPSEVEDERLDYHQYPTTSTNLVNSFEEFKKGRKQLRNLQEDARNESYALRNQLVDYWKKRQEPIRAVDIVQAADGIPPALPTADIRSPAGDTGDIGDESEFEIVNKSHLAPTPPTLSTHGEAQPRDKQRVPKAASSTRSFKARSPPVDHSARSAPKKRKPYGRAGLKDGQD